MIKFLAVFIAAILALSLISVSYAQQQNATSLQIQIVPQIQRGHQQHLTIFAVDDQGNQVNGSGEIISSIENERGVLVGPKTVYTETGEDVSYKVGPNTRPQNISVNSCLSDAEICAEQSYYVFPKGQAQVPTGPEPEFPPPLPVPTPVVPVTNDSEDGEIVIPANETEVTEPENATDVTINDTGEAEPLPPIITNETTPTPAPEPEPIPPVINETIPIPIPSNETSQNETIPIPLPINETDTNQTVPIPPLPIEPEIPPTEEPAAGNQTEELPPEIPASNETTTEPIPIPVNETTGNETIPVPPIEVTPPTETNTTQNATVEEPEPLPPSNGGQTPNGTTPVESETPTGENETETIPIDGNVSVPTEPEAPTGENETIPIEGNVTIPTEPPVTEEPQLNATEAFNQLENVTAAQDQKLDEVREDGNDANRGELKALLGDTSDAVGDVAPVVVNATNEQLQILQNSFVSGSESIDEILNPNEAEDEGGEDQ